MEVNMFIWKQKFFESIHSFFQDSIFMIVFTDVYILKVTVYTGIRKGNFLHTLLSVYAIRIWFQCTQPFFIRIYYFCLHF